VDAETDGRARQAIKDAFAGGAPQVLAIMTGAVTCGPGYWSVLKKDPAIAAASPIPTYFKVSNTLTGEVQSLEGATFKETPGRKALADRLASDIGKAPSIRKLHADELQIFWAMIPFDIEEPIYICEANDKRFLINLRQENGQVTIFWVDELSTYKTGK
jgi:hypothetical protein